MATLHFASGDNLNAQGDFTPAQAGFNLADVQSPAQLNALPDGVNGLIWLNQGDGVTQDFINEVTPYIGNPKAFGFYLVDEPDPTGQWGKQVSADNLRAESDWIHEHVPGAKTFITMMNMGSSDHPDFTNTYNPQNTHIDLYGLDPYPVHSESSTVDYNMIDRTVAAAESSGIPHDQIVPVFQTFGGGGWVDEQGGKYVMPSAAQEQQMLDHWAALVPNPVFDYAYAWGSQNGDQALESSPELQNVFLHHNAGGSAGVPTSGVSDPVTATDPSAATGSSTTAPETSNAGDPVTATDASGAKGSSTAVTPPASTADHSAATQPAANESATTNTVSGHHHGLGFSQLAVADPAFSAAHHHAFALSGANGTAGADMNASSSNISDAIHHLAQIGLDTAQLHGVEHVDHHWSWHL